MEYIKRKLRKSVNFPATIKSIGWMMKYLQFTAIDLTEIYEGTFNKMRHLLCWIHMIFVSFGFVFGASVIDSDSVYRFVNNDYFPNNFKQLLGLGLSLTILSMTMRFDHLLCQAKSGLSCYKMFYALQHDIKSEHELIDKNYKRLSIYSQLIDWIYLRCMGIMMISIVLVGTMYIVLVCNKFGFQLISPLCLYWIIMVSMPVSLTPVLGGITI